MECVRVGVKVRWARGVFQPRDPVHRTFQGRLKTEVLMILSLSSVAWGADPAGTVEMGWSLYKAGDFRGAASAFAERLQEAPGDLDARTGLGFARLQVGELQAAADDLERVLAARPGDPDAIEGLSLLIERGGAPERRFRPDRGGAGPLDVPVRTLRDVFEMRSPVGRFDRMFVTGVNLGTALPGHFATEAPRDVRVYAGWLDTISGFGANTVRVYTLLPPEFYRALAEHNRRPGASVLWILQGVWAELPETGDFGEERYLAELHAEVARAIDAVHGDLATPPRPGHASGRYDADVSSHLLGYILGREWEPYAVKAYDAQHPERAAFEGTWFRSKDGGAMEAWVAALCDFAAGYEARRYGTLHPTAFANWPTLDPLTHPTEADRREEDAWRRKYGVPFPQHLNGEPWEDDAVSLDATRVVPTARMAAGSFAAYHVYPNYPDFMYREGTYGQYLRRLKRYHGRQPLLVAEFGISTSRGIAHVEPSGLSHGGHDERRQGERLAEMIGTIRGTGCAGGIVFELMDEWFKGTWSVAPLELPAERRRLWFDAESPEQSYGLVANRPAAPVVVDGDPGDWGAKAETDRTGWLALHDVRALADAGYLYLLVRTGGGPSPPDLGGSVAYRIAIDTYDPERGETSLPPPGPATIGTGAEFSIELSGPGQSAVRVTAPYDPYASIEDGPAASPRGGCGRFIPLTFEANRERFGRDGTRYPAVRVERGALRYGSLDPTAKDFDTRTDVAIGAATGTIELRVPWGLLNVTDPSSRRVLHQETAHAPPLDTVVTDGFRIYAFALDPRDPSAPPVSRFPSGGPAPLFTWPGWEVPAYRTETKRGIDAVRRAFEEAARAR
jgi:hypothetical protein